MGSRLLGFLKAAAITGAVVVATCAGCDALVSNALSPRDVQEVRVSPDGTHLVRFVHEGAWAGDRDTLDLEVESLDGEITPLVRRTPSFSGLTWLSPTELRIEGVNLDTIVIDAHPPGLRVTFAKIGPTIYWYGDPL